MKNLILLTLLLFCCLQANGQNYFQLANDCFDKGDYECAKRNYTFFQTFDGSNMSAQIQRADECFRALIIADNYFKEDEWEKAKENYQLVLDKNPKDPHAKKQLDLCEERLASVEEIPEDSEDKNILEEEHIIKEENQQIPVDINEVKTSENEILPVQRIKYPNNLHLQKGAISHRSGLLFVAGGVGIAGGIAASILSAKHYTEVSNGMMINGKEYNLIYAATGIVVGGVCIGTGIKLKKKAKSQPNMDYGYNGSHSTLYRDNYSRLNLVVYGNEAGIRLTF